MKELHTRQLQRIVTSKLRATTSVHFLCLSMDLFLYSLAYCTTCSLYLTVYACLLDNDIVNGAMACGIRIRLLSDTTMSDVGVHCAFPFDLFTFSFNLSAFSFNLSPFPSTFRLFLHPFMHKQECVASVTLDSRINENVWLNFLCAIASF